MAGKSDNGESAEARDKRLKQALRDNLKRRKQAARRGEPAKPPERSTE